MGEVGKRQYIVRVPKIGLVLVTERADGAVESLLSIPENVRLPDSVQILENVRLPECVNIVLKNVPPGARIPESIRESLLRSLPHSVPETARISESVKTILGSANIPEGVRMPKSIPESVSVPKNVSVQENVLENVKVPGSVLERLSRVPGSKTDSETNRERQKSSSQSSSEATPNSEATITPVSKPTMDALEQLRIDEQAKVEQAGLALYTATCLRDIRHHLNLSQRQVAERSRQIAERERNPEFRVTPWWLSRVEHGAGFRPPKLLALAEIYNLTIPELILCWSNRHRELIAYRAAELAGRTDDADDIPDVPDDQEEEE